MSEIEDIVLDHDKRGVSQLRHLLPDNYCTEAARLVLAHEGQALICTGFYILAASAPETDGPPGAYYLGKALESLGYSVAYVTDRYSAFLFEGIISPEALVDFPITDVQSSQRFAQDVLARFRASVVISTERCGLTATGRYLNMRGVDITPYTAMLDYLITGYDATVGIGDGGNEIGMGNLAEHIPAVATLPKEPTITRVSKLILASVSNWGAYGLIAALSLQSRRNLLPSPDEEAALIRRMVDRGAVDGTLAQRTYAVDGFPLEENREALERLHGYLAREGLPAS
ncbi:MAG: DUF4392 domain-containing protein [Chloroflexi bacterium]|nr:DUF4392 domain-containing protein [Chloroflexota bacterium]